MDLKTKTALIVGAGPAGLMAADVLAEAGVAVTLIERMPTPARKFLMAGRGGLNLTNAEAMTDFLQRYSSVGEGFGTLEASVRAFPPQRLVRWVEDLGVDTFVGTSGRVFPKDMKAAPLLRACLDRLGTLGATLETRTEWRGFDADGRLILRTATGEAQARTADVVIIATGGASWPRLGADGRGLALLADDGLQLHPISPSNVGVLIDWSEPMRAQAGEPLKRIIVRVGDATAMGEAMITSRGLEGGVIYALSAPLRQALATGPARISVDLRPEETVDILTDRLARQLAHSKTSLSGVLRKGARMSPAAAALLREAHGGHPPRDPLHLAEAIKAVALSVRGVAGLERAISTAGGIALSEVDERLMVRSRPGVFLAGELLDWDAPTGGYLLQMCFATGHRAAVGALQWLTAAPDRLAPLDQTP